MLVHDERDMQTFCSQNLPVPYVGDSFADLSLSLTSHTSLTPHHHILTPFFTLLSSLALTSLTHSRFLPHHHNAFQRH